MENTPKNTPVRLSRGDVRVFAGCGPDVDRDLWYNKVESKENINRIQR